MARRGEQAGLQLTPTEASIVMRERNLQLDLLRCAAILGVLVAHTVLFRTPKWWWDRLAVTPSWTGVDLFFVISGFLISGLLFSEFQGRGRINFGRFAIRRALKLYPVLYVLVVGLMLHRLVHSGFHDVGWIITPALHDIFFVQSYWPGTYGHFWSLAVEEHFYILLPLTLFFMIRQARAGETDPFRKLPLVFLLVAIFSVSARLVHAVIVQPYSHVTHLFPTHFRLDSLLFGVLLSYWYRFHSDKFNASIRRIRLFLFPLSFLLILPAIILESSSFIVYTVGLSSLYLGYGCLMIALLKVPLTTAGFSGWLLRPLSYIGKHSYPIYLFHILILEQLRKHDLLRTWVYFVSSIAVGILLSKLIEFPVLHLRDRLFPAEVPTQALSRIGPDKRLAVTP
jgi:peptidoglycan/LPS O-acetylase OafA/YrhL